MRTRKCRACKGSGKNYQYNDAGIECSPCEGKGRVDAPIVARVNYTCVCVQCGYRWPRSIPTSSTVFKIAEGGEEKTYCGACRAENQGNRYVIMASELSTKASELRKQQMRAHAARCKKGVRT